jgi:hypothetical protein
MPSIKCPHCGNGLKVPDSVIGKTGKCPKCQQKFVIELPSADPYDLAPLASAPLPGSPLGPALTSASPAPLGVSQPAAPSRPAWIIPAAIGGGVLALLVVVGAAIAAMGMLGGGDGGAVNGGPVAGAPAPAVGGAPATAGQHSGLIDLTREAESGEGSPVPPAPLLDAAEGWKVTVDGATAPAGLKSAFALNRNPTHMNSEISGVIFSSPTAAKAAVFHREQARGLEWTQYDLTKDEPGTRVTLFPENDHLGSPLVAALSPSGERLALRSPFKGDESPGVVYVCGTDGQPLVRVELTLPSDQITWVGMPDESRLLVLAGDRVRGFDVPSGMPRFEIVGVLQPPTLSPGNQWLAALFTTGVRWYSTQGGLEAGHLPLPEKWFEPTPGRNPRPEYAGKRIGRVAISPSGKTAVLLVANPHAELYVASWDLATGKALGAFLLPWAHAQADLAPECIWVGQRQILLAGGQLVDLDARTWVAEYNLGLFVRGSPDGRAWRVLPLSLQQLEAVVPKLSPVQAEIVEQTHCILAATTVFTPDIANQLAQAKQGLLWRPGMEVRLEIAGGMPPEERDAMVKLLGDIVAKMGMRINPKAKYGLRTNLGVKDGLVVVKREPWYDTRYDWVTYGAGKKGKILFSVVDEQFNPIFAVPGSIEIDRTPEAGGEPKVWEDMRKLLWRIELPRVYFRDAAGKRLPLALHVGRKIPLGIDGVLEAPQPEYTPTDSYELPADRGY